MASPYQGQADDFDIDIDLMEDHISNMDSDMMGADEFPNASQPSLFPNDAIDDADMVDEPSEGSMVDADNLADEDHDVDVQYNEVTYEAEMLEGDHEEATQTPMPVINIESTADTEPQTTEAIENVPETAEESKQEEQEVQKFPPATIPAENQTQDQGISLSSHDVQNAEPEYPQTNEDAEPGTNHEKIETSEEINETAENNLLNDQDHHTTVEPSDGNVEASQIESSSQEVKGAIAESLETHDSHVAEEQGSHDDETLHPVKVIYQDSEISLFPPLEGDSAETFFLHDEDVAYDNFGKLFSSLREVLLDNIAENEVLVIDIDSLGIQITEVSKTAGRTDFVHFQLIVIYRTLRTHLK